MSTTETYKVISNNAPIKNRPSLFASTLGRLKKGTLIEVISISNIWSYFKYKNKDAYILTYYIEKVETVITGSITIKYIDKNTSLSIAESKVYDNLELGTYSYDALDILGYKISGESTKSTEISKDSPNQSISFEYSQILGRVTIQYFDIDANVEISESDVYTDLTIGEHTYSAKSISGYVLASTDTQTVTLAYDNFVQVLVFEYKKDTSEDSIYTIDLEKYNISNDNTNATATTKGINQALVDAKTDGYKRVKLPEGHYAIDTSLSYRSSFTDNYGSNFYCDGKGISMHSNLELILEGCILEMIPCLDPYYSILAINNCSYSKITGGIILGDRDTHNYGMRINNTGDELESGDIDYITGDLIEDSTRIRTKNFISVYKDWFTNEEMILPTKFHIIPLWNTTKNTVDGGVRYVYCYDKEENYLGTASTNGNSFLSEAILLDNTAKIKISFKDETNIKAVYALTKLNVYYTSEFGCGISIRSSNNIDIDSTVVKNCIGDCVLVRETLLEDTMSDVNNLYLFNCTLENSRRQGISFVAKGGNHLIENCNIGSINGVDPQCGIDFETGQSVGDIHDIIINNCNFYNNRKWDIDNYDGSSIEIKNSKFNGSIATVYGDTMKIHDNTFYFNKENVIDINVKLFNKSGVQLGTFKNIVYNNRFTNSSVDNYGDNSQTYNNIFINSYHAITDNGINEYHDCDNIILEFSTNFTIYKDATFDNCIVNLSARNWEAERTIKNCIFNNTQLNPTSLTILEHCTFNVNNIQIRKSEFTLDTSIIYNNCEFNSTYTSDYALLANTNYNTTFNSCNFNISRYMLSRNYGSLNFNNCTFIFNNLNTNEERIYLTSSPYGYTISPWFFNNCYFKSDYPVQIDGGNVVNPTIVGKVTYS